MRTDVVSNNRLLTDIDREHYKKLIEKMHEVCPEMMNRKISRANVQQAFMLDVVGREIGDNTGSSALCVGCFEDTAYECMLRFGLPVVGIDPDINVDLHGYVHDSPKEYDVVFSTSVLEHVIDDEGFIGDFCSVLKAGGLGVITCDFNNEYKPGDLLPYTDLRFYTESDLRDRILPILEKANCALVDEPEWSGNLDFTHDGCNYSFATIVFRKVS